MDFLCHLKRALVAEMPPELVDYEEQSRSAKEARYPPLICAIVLILLSATLWTIIVVCARAIFIT